MFINLLDSVLHWEKRASCHGRRRCRIIPADSGCPYPGHVYEVKKWIPEKHSLELWAQKMESSKNQMVSRRRFKQMGHGSHIVSLLKPTISLTFTYFFSSPSCIIFLILVTFVLASAIAERKRDIAPTNLGALWREGLGAFGDHEMIEHKKVPLTATQSFYFSVVAANSFQLVFSFFYYMYNGLLTSMSVASELSRHGSTRKPLRVSAPIGMQQSSHFLSLPYRFGVPLTISSGLMHWFISQSIFFVRTVAYYPDGTEDPPKNTSRVGFSLVGIVFAFSLVIAMLVALGVLALVKKYPDAMPLMSTNRAAISAACHPPTHDTDSHLLPVQWGVISSNDSIIGKCSFTTSRDVQAPVPGFLYSWWFFFLGGGSSFFCCCCLKTQQNKIYKIFCIPHFLNFPLFIWIAQKHPGL